MATLSLYGWTSHDKTGKERVPCVWWFFSKEECETWMIKCKDHNFFKLVEINVPRPPTCAIINAVCLWTLYNMITKKLQEIGQVYHLVHEYMGLGWKMTAEKAIQSFLPIDTNDYIFNSSCLADCQTVLQLMGYDTVCTEEDLKETIEDVSHDRWGRRLLRLEKHCWSPLFQYARYVLYVKKM